MKFNNDMSCIKIPVFPGCSWFDKVICTPIKAQRKSVDATGQRLEKQDKSTLEKPFACVLLVLCDGVCECLWPPYILRVWIRTKLHQDFGHVNVFPSAADVKRHVSVCLETQFNHHNTNHAFIQFMLECKIGSYCFKTSSFDSGFDVTGQWHMRMYNIFQKKFSKAIFEFMCFWKTFILMST